MSPLRRPLLLALLALLQAGAWAPWLTKALKSHGADAGTTATATWVPDIAAAAAERIGAGTRRAIATYAAARALNGVISAVKATTVAIEPGGVGLTLAPAQVLEPINHLVEQFSDLMLAAIVSFGVQRVFIAIGSQAAVSVALTVAVLATGGFLLRQRAQPRWWGRILFALILVRFAVPLADPRKYVESYVERVSVMLKETVSHITNLIDVFLLQTLVLPVLLLWALIRIGRAALGAAAPR